MTRMVKEYLKTLKVLYHGGYCTCGTKWCNGHIVNNNFEELSVGEFIFVKLKLGILPKFTTEVEEMKSPSELFKFARRSDNEDNIDQVLIKRGCKAYYIPPLNHED